MPKLIQRIGLSNMSVYDVMVVREKHSFLLSFLY